jgi:hypothetical protein
MPLNKQILKTISGLKEIKPFIIVKVLFALKPLKSTSNKVSIPSNCFNFDFVSEALFKV